MRNNGKKILSLVAAATFLGATFAMAGCDVKNYSGEKLGDYVSSQNKAESNGGFAVEKDGFVYFINGAESNTAENKFGEVVKGSLMRISKSDLENGNYENVKTVVPMLFVAQNFASGIYIYGDYVFYATPTTDKNINGEVENTWIDFKCAKLDGTDTMKNYYFRLENNAATYRFVEENGAVYCLYEEDSALKSYKVAENGVPVTDGKSVVLVKGAKSSFFYDTKDLTNPNVYYTMSVVYDADSDNSQTASYDQLYCVNAAATATVDAEKAAYTVGNKTYDFDEAYMKAQNKTAKNNKEDEPYDFSDYTTYPYVNLGTLVLDGIGANSSKETQFNNNSKSDAQTPDGYNYTISGYQNGGVYFTRAEVTQTSSDGENTKLYYLSDTASKADGWNSVKANADKLTTVALDTTNASSSAIFNVKADGSHEYLYIADDVLYKAQPDAKGEANAFALAYNVSGATLWTTEGDYLYYSVSGDNGNNLVRINYTGSADDYNPITATDDCKPLQIAYIDYNSGWYNPEFFGDTVLFSGAQADGSTSYNYIYAAKLGSTEDIIARNEKYEAVQDRIEEYSSNTALQNAMKYYFQTGERALFDNVKDLYSDYQIEKFEEFVADTELVEYTYFAKLVGTIKSEDKESIEEGWANTLLTETEDEEDESGLPTWAIWTIVGGSVVVVAAAVVVIVCVLKKKKNEKRAEEATVNAYKRKKIDTTDDKSIDVYADDQSEE